METSLNTSANWSISKKLALRFFAAYFLLYCFFTFFEMYSLWTPVITWLGRQLKLFKKLEVFPNGSGDTTYNYLQILCLLVFAVMISIVWSVIDHKRKHYDKLLYWLFVMLRYVLAFFLLFYGFSKIYKVQFPFPYLQRLLQPYGNSSPMGLAWTFMGYSTAFNMFTGIAEALGGIFLLFRRTTTFGALFSMTVLTNIVAMNFCFDIPVKLFSLHLLLMAIFIAVPDMKRLIDLFFKNKAVAAASFPYPVFSKKWIRVTLTIVKALLVIVLIGLPAYQNMQDVKEYGDDAPKPPLYGIYTVESFIKNDITVLPLATDTAAWHYFVIDGEKGASVRTMSDKVLYFELDADTVKNLLIIKNQTGDSTMLQYRLADTAHLFLSGVLFRDSVKITLKKKNLNDFKLVGRRFHWINEYPYNR